MVAALYRRYRPETFAEMIGQQQVTDPLSVAIRSGRINHAYLFSGPRGCGKTSSARILARCLNCEAGPTPEPCGKCDSCLELGRNGGGSLDVHEIDAASHGGVEDARELRERAIMAPSRDRYRIFIIDEAHMVTSQGFNALLKVVEEPPEHVLFIFATTEPEKVIGTIRSRTHHYPFRLIPPAPMLDYLERICAAEQISAEAGVLPLVVRAGGGSARDTMSLLDQLIAGTEGETMQYGLATQVLGFTSQELLDDTISAFADADSAAAYRSVDAVIQSGQDPRRFVEDLLERVRDLIVVKAIGQGAEAVLRGISPEELERMRAAASRFTPRALSGMADAVNSTLSEMTGVTAPRVQLELMIARVLVAQRAAFADGGQDAPVAAPAPAAGGSDARAGVPGQSEPGRQESPAPQARGERPAPQRDARADAAPQRGAAGGAADGGQTGSAGQQRADQRPAPTQHAAPKQSAAEAAKAAWATPGVTPDEPAKPSAPTRPADQPASQPTDRPASQPPASPGPASAAAAPSEQAAQQLTTNQVRDAWPSVLEAVTRLGGRPAWSLVQGLQPMKFESGLLDVWFPNRGIFNQVRQSHEGQPSPSDHLKQALREVFGIDMKIAPKIGHGTGREPGQQQPDAPAGPADEERHRAGRGSAPTAAPSDSSTAAQTSSKPAQGAPPTAAPGGTWNVAPIPGEPRVADDGPGSAWDEFATTSESAASPEPEAEAEAASPEEVAASEASEREQEQAPVDLPEVTLHASTAADVRNPIAAEPQRDERSTSAPAESGTEPAEASPEPAPGRSNDEGRASAVSAQVAPAAPSAPTAPSEPAAPSAPPAPSWNVVTVPGNEPEPEPEPATPAEPDEPAGPKHPALSAGQERYGESVIRERLGARFVGEELRQFAEPAGPFDEAPDDFEAPPEEY